MPGEITESQSVSPDVVVTGGILEVGEDRGPKLYTANPTVALGLPLEPGKRRADGRSTPTSGMCSAGERRTLTGGERFRGWATYLVPYTEWVQDRLGDARVWDSVSYSKVIHYASIVCGCNYISSLALTLALISISLHSHRA